MVLLIIIVIITNAAGIGGGGAILPIMMIFNFNITQAVALSNLVIFIGAVTRFLMDFRTSHPMKKATIIDYGVVIIMMPCIMIGSFIGTQANIASPSAVTLVILLGVMIFLSVKTSKQGLKIYRDEIEHEKAMALLDIEPDDDSIEEDQEALKNDIKEVEMQVIEPNHSAPNSIVVHPDDSLNTVMLK